MKKLVVIVSFMAIASGCGTSPSNQLSALSEEFVYTTLSFSPSAATAAGLHHYKKESLDDVLDDVGPLSLARQRRFYEDFKQRLAAVKTERLTSEESTDLTILQNQTALALLDFDVIRSSQHNPTTYVETLGNALFNPYVLEYAPLRSRIQNIIARLQKVPLFLDQASGNLDAAPLIWTQVVIEENDGNINLVDKVIRGAVPDDLQQAYAKAARPAVDAMTKFQAYIEGSLSNRT